ncbi:MAG TPA: polysaccharide deacetylase family protein, partial [Rubrobacteraceae bacterium]|nr:polysaccharide deacetylase family protein [Rubrobacteraceae bacterium]
SEILGEEVEGFCYPYGGVDRAVIRAVQRAGYNYACSWRIRPEQNVYDLPRIPVTNRERFMRFAAKLAIYPQYTGLSGDRNASWVP